MSDKVLYGYSAIFSSADEIIHAAEKTQEAGYTKYDTHTPYPIHGMPKAMKLPHSKLGMIALFFGLSGTTLALAMTYWMSAVDYPLIIGGKPFFSFPAYVPIMFELTVLTASVMTVLTMLLVFFKFPNNKHPLHETDYMKSVSSDRLGLVIEAEDELFEEEKIRTFLISLKPERIEPIYVDLLEYDYKPNILHPIFVTILVFAIIATSTVTYFGLNKLLNLPPFSWMMEQTKINPQEASAIFADGFSMRNPVKETVARGYMPYKFSASPDSASEYLINPLEFSELELEIGKKNYNIYCSPCHGYFGEGDSRLKGSFPNPPSLHSEKVRNWTDGRIFHVIQMGQNVMPSYATQMSRNEMWATILYIRALQRSLNAKETDL